MMRIRYLNWPAASTTATVPEQVSEQADFPGTVSAQEEYDRIMAQEGDSQQTIEYPTNIDTNDAVEAPIPSSDPSSLNPDDFDTTTEYFAATAYYAEEKKKQFKT